MKVLRVSLAVTLITGTITAALLSQTAYGAKTGDSNSAEVKGGKAAIHEIEVSIDADREKIIEEMKAIKVDRKKLKDTEKLADKVKAEAMKREIVQEIEKRQAAIKDLKKNISDKKYQRNELMYGKAQGISRKRIAK